MWFVTLIGIAICLLAVARLMRSEKCTLAKRFSGRKNINIEKQIKIFSEYNFLNESKSFLLFGEIAEVLEIEPEKLRLEDRFDNEIKSITGMEFDDHLSALTLLLESYAKKDNLSVDVSKLKNISDCLLALAKQKGRINAKGAHLDN
jgi:hypothetical protein